MAHAAARRGFWAGWIYGAGAVTGDLVMLALTGLGVLRVIDALPWAKVAFAFVGAGLMAWFAWGAWRTARAGTTPDAVEERAISLAREFTKAFAIVTTSPYNWAWWLTAGTSMVGILGWSAALGFFVGIVLWITVWSGLATAGGQRVRRLAEFVSYGAALVLAAFAAMMAWYAVASAMALLAAPS